MSPEPIEVRRCRRRRRTVSAYREGGRTIVLIPAGFSASEEKHWVDTMLRKLEAGDRRRRPSDEQLAARAAELSLRYLGGLAKPTSIVWSMNQPSHGRDFWALLESYPRTERARGYLEGVVAAGALGAPGEGEGEPLADDVEDQPLRPSAS